MSGSESGSEPELTSGSRRTELIAHRAGNAAGRVAAVRDLADTVELDVRLDRGRMVVRHPRRIWFTDRLWERWYLVPPGRVVPTFEQALDLVEIESGDGRRPGLWIDCKGLTPRLPPRALEAAIARSDGLGPITVSSKAWWALGPVSGRPGVRVVRSISNRFELFLLRRLPSRLTPDGIVLHSRLAQKPLVSALRERYGTVFSWSIPDAATGRRLVSWGVDGLIVDEPEVMNELGGARPDSGGPGG